MRQIVIESTGDPAAVERAMNEGKQVLEHVQGRIECRDVSGGAPGRPPVRTHGNLEIIAGGNKNPAMKTMVNGLKTDIEGGASIYEAMGKFPVQFDELYRNLVRAGESSGVLETVLETIANYKENIESIKGKIKKALFYPATVIAVAIIVCAILLIFVVPTFKETFVSFGADLPAFTALVFGISEVVVAWWWLIAISAAVAIGAFLFVYKRSVPLQHLVDRMMLKIPVIGTIMHNSAIARFARTTRAWASL